MPRYIDQIRAFCEAALSAEQESLMVRGLRETDGYSTDEGARASLKDHENTLKSLPLPVCSNRVRILVKAARAAGFDEKSLPSEEALQRLEDQDRPWPLLLEEVAAA